MKLTVKKRPVDKKSQSKKLRREGKIPAVIYSNGSEGESVAVPESEFSALLRQLTPGSLANSIVTLDGEGNGRRAIVKGIQYHPTTYDVMHLDFEELHDDVKVKLKIPVRFTGVPDCVGIKQGGVLRSVIRHLQVECLPKDIPTEFTLDVRPLDINGKRRLADIEMPANVRPLADLHEVAVVIAKR